MNTRTSTGLAAAVLFAGITAASAAEMQSPPPTDPGVQASQSPGDLLKLTTAQRKRAWHDLYVKSLNQASPAGFSAATGAVLPQSVQTAPITDRAAGDVPALRPYDFAMLQKKLVIVNPADRKIAEVIGK